MQRAQQISSLAICALVLLSATTATVASADVPRAKSLPIPTLFAPGIISGPSNDGAPTFAPDGLVLYFERSFGRRAIIFESRWLDRRWSTPHVAAFSGPSSDQHPAFSPDGRYLIFASSRAPTAATAAGATPKRSNHLWRVDRSGSGWSAPVELPATVNISNRVFKPSIAANGDLFFMSAESSGANGPNWRLYRSALVKGSYQAAEPLAFSDGKTADVDPYIAPDQSWLIFSSSGRQTPDDGHEHLYVSVRQGAGWGAVQALHYEGDDWGADDGEAQVSPDGKTLYFSSSRSAPVDRTLTGQKLLDDVARNEAWDNGTGNAWSIPLQALFDANGIVVVRHPD
jgi:Tol biopolymer transport system component